MKVQSVLRLVCFVLSLLMVFLIPSIGYTSSVSFGGVSLTALGRTELVNPSLYVIAATNKSLMITLNSQFRVKGNQTIIMTHFFKGESLATLMSNATIDVTLLWYYAPGGGVNYEWVSTGFWRLLVVPNNTTGEVLYRIDLREIANNVFNYYSSKVSNLTVEDVGFGGIFSIYTQFSNSTGAISNTGYLRFPLYLDGNMSSLSLDFTIPEEYEMITAKFGTDDMTKIFPNRVTTSFTVTKNQTKTSEVYMEWKIPVPPPPPPWYDVPPWRWVIPGLIGIGLTIVVRDIFPRLWKRYKGKLASPATMV